MVLAVSELGLAVVAALGAALGAAVGGGITGLVTLKAEDKRQQFSRELEQRRFDERSADLLSELRVAGRLVLNELNRVKARLTSARRSEARMAPVPLPLEAWDANRDMLARTLSVDAWAAVTGAYGALDIYRAALEDGTVDPAAIPGLVETVERAADALLPYVAGASMPVNIDLPPAPPRVDQEAEPPPKEQ
jgi:hypothetical protein